MIPMFQRYLLDLQNLPGDLGRSWRSDGLSGVGVEVRRRSLDRVAVRARSLVIEGDLDDVRAVPPPRGVEVRPCAGDWTKMGALVAPRLTLHFSAASNAGRRSLVAWRGARPVGYVWLSPAMDLRFDKFTLPLPEDAMYLWVARVLREERRKGVGGALVSAALHQARALGWSRVWMIIRPANRASLRVASALMPSSHVLGSVTRTTLLTWMTSRYDALPTPVPLSRALQS
jgi:GNAT superfamily N-acetyltransferase